MATWNSPAQVPMPPMIRTDIDPTMDDVRALYEYVKKIANVVSAHKNDLEYMLNGNLDANNIRSNSIETKNLKAGSVTADKISVNELSAISANLGHITAGLIEAVTMIGSEIMTSDSSYPRVVLASSGNIFEALKSSTESIAIDPDATSGPTLFFESPNSAAFISPISSTGQLALNSLVGEISINAQSDNLRLSAADEMVLSCDDLRINGDVGWSGDFTIDSTTITVKNGIITDVS